MSKEKITKKIIEEARKEVESIISKARSRAREILKNAEDEAQKIMAEAQRDAERIKKREIENILGLHRIEIRKRLLKEKRKFIKDVFDKAFSEIASDDKLYEALAKRILEENIVHGNETVICASNDKTVKSLVDRLNRQKGWNLSVESDDSVVKGFVIRAHGHEINFKLSMIEEAVRTDLEGEVAKILFQRK
ncbi:MAG: hypothetical protein DRQ10_00355 [Candidatus Hydrothermota bacterium]|nr:MAG: hypothetical protein DRQ10_00355 [Candidatus Hydrothermae bacterium]